MEIKRWAQDWDDASYVASPHVERLWRQHIIDINNYKQDCILLCGRLVGHSPDCGDDLETQKNKRQNILQALKAKVDDDNVDRQVWADFFLLDASAAPARMTLDDDKHGPAYEV